MQIPVPLRQDGQHGPNHVIGQLLKLHLCFCAEHGQRLINKLLRRLQLVQAVRVSLLKESTSKIDQQKIGKGCHSPAM